MPTLRLDIAYDGAGFSGYAAQPGRRTIQGALEDALCTLLGSVPDTSVAGRTDAGVHARGQVVSFQTETEIDPARLMRSLNGLVGPEITVFAAAPVVDGFDARHSALWRRYRYTLDTGAGPDPLTRGIAWHVGPSLSWDEMSHAAGLLLGEHDFTSFCRSVEGRSNVRTMDESRLAENDGLWEFWVRANAFCHQMVRSLMGHLYDVGRGFASAGDVLDVIEARDRGRVASVAPPHGLTLWEVGYSAERGR